MKQNFGRFIFTTRPPDLQTFRIPLNRLGTSLVLMAAKGIPNLGIIFAHYSFFTYLWAFFYYGDLTQWGQSQFEIAFSFLFIGHFIRRFEQSIMRKFRKIFSCILFKLRFSKKAKIF